MAIFTHLTLGYDDLDQAKDFYDDVLAALDLVRLMEMPNGSAAYGPEGSGPEFVVLKPADGNPATSANGLTIGFAAKNRAAVDEFHRRGLAKGGTDEGAPGPRPITPTAYGAYIRDIGGHKICAFTMSAE
jgi:catechol 2,3-dioxygenase-like lactoylglutathione lyase family enzyme